MQIPRACDMPARIDVCGACHTDLQVAEGDIHPILMPVIPALDGRWC